MAHKWLIKAEFTAYKVYRYFTQVCLGRFMCKLSVSGLQIISTPPPQKKNIKNKSWKMALWLNSVWYQIGGIQEIQTQCAGAN